MGFSKNTQMDSFDIEIWKSLKDNDLKVIKLLHKEIKEPPTTFKVDWNYALEMYNKIWVEVNKENKEATFLDQIVLWSFIRTRVYYIKDLVEN